MRSVTADRLEALSGSRGLETASITVWYDGRPVAVDVPLESWSLTADADREVNATLSYTVADPDGTLAPWSHTDTLGAAGHVAQLSYRFGTVGAPDFDQHLIGWYTHTNVTPRETFRVASTGVWIPTGASISVTADDLTWDGNVPFPGTDAPPTGATRKSEIVRLLAGIVPVRFAAGITDSSAATEAYTGTRLSAVMDHVRALNCAARMGADGLLDVYPDTAPAVSWTVLGGTAGNLITSNRAYAKADIVNMGVAEASGGTPPELVGRSPITDGPYRWGGPAGFRPKVHAAPIYTTQEAVDAGAATVLARALAERVVDFVVTCLPNPFVELGDSWRLLIPSWWGTDLDVTGRVASYHLSGDAGGVGPMSATVRVPADVVTAAVGRARV